MRVAGIIALLGCVIGCGGSSGTSGSRTDKLSGHWQYVSGPMVVGASIDKINYLDLTSSGAGTLFTSSLNDGINGCGPIVFAVLSDNTVAFDLPDFTDEGVATQYYQYAQPSADRLTLTDAFGNVTTFQKATDIPSSVTCQTPTIGNPVTIPSDRAPEYASGLASDATMLWFSPHNGGALPFNPANGTTGTAINFPAAGQYQYVSALQGTDFWLNCWCGSNSYLQRRRTNGSLVSSFDLSAAPINRQLSIQAASYDASNLWVGGYQYDLGKNVILKLNAELSPPTVLSVINFDAEINGLTLKGGELWVLGNYVEPVLVNINAATGVAKATYRLPHGHSYRGLTVIGNTFYTIRYTGSGRSYDIIPITIP